MPVEEFAAQPVNGTAATGLPRTLALGIDFGGTGIKAALVDTTTGDLVSSRIRLETPRPATPKAVAATITTIVKRLSRDLKIPEDTPVGLGLPGVVKDGVVMTAANIDGTWVGASANDVIGAALKRRVFAINDADAAGVAEVRLGAGRDVRGTVVLLTVGTGIGSGLFVNGQLVPNTELGHLELNGRDAETRVSAAARERRRLRWKSWANEFNEYLARIDAYFWPDLIILGGGVSKVIDKYGDLLKSRAPLAVAQYRNTSGIIGAALNASDRVRDDAMRAFSISLAEAEGLTQPEATVPSAPESALARPQLAPTQPQRD